MEDDKNLRNALEAIKLNYDDYINKSVYEQLNLVSQRWKYMTAEQAINLANAIICTD